MLNASPVFIPSRKNLFSPFQTIRWNSRAKKSGISHRSNTLKSAQSSKVGFFATPDGAFGIEACPRERKHSERLLTHGDRKLSTLGKRSWCFFSVAQMPRRTLRNYSMPIADLFPGLFAQFTRTAHFDDKTIAAVEKLVVRKNDNAYIKCLVRQKEVLAKPEEIIRQLCLHQLLHRYKYPLSRIQMEYPVTFGRDTSKRADIVIFDADRPTVPYIIIEVKQATAKGGKEQLKSYTHATGAPLAVWSDGTQVIVWHRKNPNYFEEIPALPGAHETIKMIAGQPWTIDTLLEYQKQRDAEGSKGRSLRQLIEDLEDEVLANAGVDVFEEVFKLIFTKLYDELSCYSDFSPHLRFRSLPALSTRANHFEVLPRRQPTSPVQREQPHGDSISRRARKAQRSHHRPNPPSPPRALRSPNAACQS